MRLFSKSEDQVPAVSKLHSAVSLAFDHVKKDIFSIFDWLDYLRKKNNEHDERLNSIEHSHNYYHQILSGIEQNHNYHTQRLAGIEQSHNKQMQRVFNIEQNHNLHTQKLAAVEQNNRSYEDRMLKIEHQLTHLSSLDNSIQTDDSKERFELLLRKIENINQRIYELEKARSDRKIGLKERLIKKITKNSKDYVKTVIRSLITKYDKISGPQLKEIVVEEQGLCSKSSFYRLLAELEQESDISIIQDGKEKIYLSKTEIMK